MTSTRNTVKKTIWCTKSKILIKTPICLDLLLAHLDRKTKRPNQKPEKLCVFGVFSRGIGQPEPEPVFRGKKTECLSVCLLTKPINKKTQFWWTATNKLSLRTTNCENRKKLPVFALVLFSPFFVLLNKVGRSVTPTSMWLFFLHHYKNNFTDHSVLLRTNVIIL